MFKDVAYFYQKLLLPSAQNNITKVCKSIEVQFRSIHGLEIATHYEELFLRLAEKYFETGRTPISISPKVLPDVKPSEHRDPDVDLPSFSKLYASFGNKSLICTLFAVQLFQEMTVKSPSSEIIITNMLEGVY